MSTSGLSVNNVFKNDGYSEIFHFTYASNCPAPTFLLSEAVSARSVRISWMGVNSHTKYHIQYRKANVAGAEWFDVYTLNTQTTLSDLEPGVTYEFRAGGSCEPAVLGNTASFTYSGINQFSMPAAGTTNTAFSCGISPTVAIANQTPINNLIVSETFTAGDFPVKILEITDANSNTNSNPNTTSNYTNYIQSGKYNGKGYIIVPYLADTKIAVVFKNITVNTNYQLINGIVETTYDPNWGNVSDVEDVTGGNNGVLVTQTVPFVITSVTINPNGDIIVSGANGEQITIPGGSNTVITGTNASGGSGSVYSVDSDGNVTGPFSPAPGGATTPQNTDGVAANGQTTEFTAQGLTVTFQTTPATKYAWDVVTDTEPSYVKDKYAKVGSTYLPYKAVINGQSDVLEAKIDITDTKIHKKDLVFKTDTGKSISFDSISNLLTLRGSLSYAEEEVQVAIKQGDKYKIAGAFKLVHLSEKPVNITLVPLNNASSIPSTASANLQAIYEKVGVKLTIKTAPVISYDGGGDNKITTSDSGVFDYYTEEEKAINAQIKALPDYDPRTYYLIYSNVASDKGIEGFMALGGQFGYVFPNASNKTAAHELAHGVFALQHPFHSKSDESKTPYLMDYGSGTELWHSDWAQINNPALKYYGFQSSSDGEFAGIRLTPDWKLFKYDGTSEHGDNKSCINNGGICKIVKDGKEYSYIVEKNDYYFNDKKLGIEIVDSAQSVIVVDYTAGCGKLYNVNLNQLKSTFNSNSALEFSNSIFKFRIDVSCIPTNEDTTQYDDKCAGKPFAELQQMVIQYNTFAQNINSKSIDEATELIIYAEFCALKDISFENKLAFIKKISAKTSYNTDNERAITKIVNAVKFNEAEKLYTYFTTNENLTNILYKINNDYLVIFNDNNKDYFTESVAYKMGELTDANKKWNIFNIIVKTNFDEIENDLVKTAIGQLLISIYKDTYAPEKVVSLTNIFAIMIKNEEDLINHNDYRIILEIAQLRIENRELFNRFTQGETLSIEIPNSFAFINLKCDVVNTTNWSWLKPGKFGVSCNNSYNEVQQSDVDIWYKWAKYLADNPTFKASFPTNPAIFLSKFKNEFTNFLQTAAIQNTAFWQNITVNCSTLTEVMAQISLNENSKSLSNVDSVKRKKTLEVFFTCPEPTSFSYASVEEGILKLLGSFEPTDASILTTIEAIGFDKIYSKLSDETLSKFLAWTGGQAYSSNHIKPMNEKWVLKDDKTIKNVSDISLKTEADLLTFQNFSGNIENKTKIKIEGVAYDYNQMVVVYVSGDFTFLGQEFKEGSVLVMPLIQAFAMSNSNRNIVAEKTAWVVFDTAMLFVGIGELKILFTAGNYLSKAILVSDLVGSASGIALNAMDESSIDPDTRYKLQLLSVIATLPQAARLVKSLDNIIANLDGKINAITNVNSRASLLDYLNKIKLRLPSTAKIQALLNSIQNTALWAKYQDLSPALKKMFENDFANASEEVLILLKKNNSELFDGWKNFRTKNPNAIICN